MPTKREFLEQLKRAELVAAVDRFELSVADRRVREQLIEALAPSQTPLDGILGVLTKDRMREISKALGIDERLKEESAANERRAPGERPGAGRSMGPGPVDTPPPRSDYYASAPERPRSAPDRGGGFRPSPGKYGPRPDRSFERRPRPSGPPRSKPINIQDGYLFESLKENRLLQFALVTGQQIKGRIRRFDQFTVLVDTGTRDVLIYKSALSDIAAG